ncbi:hypothetical protein J6590_010408 [Homalodisca vitripennis]|nr:hypothetical protein J6590_010408 [Homalodisca vitripennis]
MRYDEAHVFQCVTSLEVRFELLGELLNQARQIGQDHGLESNYSYNNGDSGAKWLHGRPNRRVRGMAGLVPTCRGRL